MFESYVKALNDIVSAATVTTRTGSAELTDVVSQIGEEMAAAHARGNRLFFVGNGGSAGIASHLAIDYSKNGGIRATALNDAAALTCLANDLGYDHVFEKQIEWHARPGDVLVAISSSGTSPNILNAAMAARRIGCRIFTLSGFRADNPLRRLGDVNIHLASSDYGFVEVGHMMILHGVLDIRMGWRADKIAQTAAA